MEARRAMRTIFAWGRRIFTVGLLVVSGFTIYRTYFDSGSDSIGESETSIASLSTTTPVNGPGGEITGFVPRGMMTVSVDGTLEGFPKRHLIDGDPQTAWACSPCVDPDVPGVGETITVRFESPVRLQRIHVFNGMPAEVFFSNHRAQRIRFTLSGETLETTLQDVPDEIPIGFPEREVESITLTVLSVFRSLEDDAGFGFSDLRFYGTFTDVG